MLEGGRRIGNSEEGTRCFGDHNRPVSCASLVPFLGKKSEDPQNEGILEITVCLLDPTLSVNELSPYSTAGEHRGISQGWHCPEDTIRVKMIQALSEIKQAPKEGLRVEQPFKIKSPCQIIHKMGISKVAPTRVADAQGPHSGCGQELSILVGGKHFAVLLTLLCLVDSILGSSWLDCEHVWG